MTDNEEMITIPKRIYDKLVDDSDWLAALESAGVDNWEGFDYAQEIFTKWNQEDEE